MGALSSARPALESTRDAGHADEREERTRLPARFDVNRLVRVYTRAPLRPPGNGVSSASFSSGLAAARTPTLACHFQGTLRDDDDETKVQAELLLCEMHKVGVCRIRRQVTNGLGERLFGCHFLVRTRVAVRRGLVRPLGAIGSRGMPRARGFPDFSHGSINLHKVESLPGRRILPH
jgi:hypothetical protein